MREPCLNFEECLTILKFGNASGFIHSPSVLFRPIYPVTTFACQCPKGFTGMYLYNFFHYKLIVEILKIINNLLQVQKNIIYVMLK